MIDENDLIRISIRKGETLTRIVTSTNKTIKESTIAEVLYQVEKALKQIQDYEKNGC